MRADGVYLGVLLCFLLSGFAALIYETAWTREFAFVFGTSELAVATVLAGYMAGLALGAALASRWADRLRRPLLIYGLLELGIGVCALLVPVAIQASTALSVILFGGADAPPDAGGTAITVYFLVCSFIILCVPAAMMGATLPLLARFAVHSPEQIGTRVGALYATNTAGAVLGTLFAAFVLLPSIGLRATIWTGVAVNMIVFGLAVLLARGITLSPQPAGEVPSRKPVWERHAWILPLMTVSGACSFFYEILWTRLLSYVLGGSVYAFATMLASFLAGIALGSAIAARLASSRERGVLGFAVCQLGIAVLSWAAYLLVNRIPDLATYLGLRGGQVDLVSFILLSALILLPGALFMGATYPFAVRTLAGATKDVGRSSGRVYAWNTVGAIIGSVAAAFFVIPELGFANGLRATVAVNLFVGLVAIVLLMPTRRAFAAGLSAVLIASVLVPLAPPENVLRFSPLGNRQSGEIRFLGIGRSATVLAIDEGEDVRLFTNGLPEAVIRPIYQPIDDLTAKWLAPFPVLARPDARSMLVVGLGGGRALERIPRSIERIDVVELEDEVVEANRFLAAYRAVDPLSDARVSVHTNDARGALVLTGRRYDIIVSQPSHPWTAGASHLYTREFFELVKSKLTEDGVFVQWIGLSLIDADLLRTLVATMNAVFPHVRLYRPPPGAAVFFVGSTSPIPIERTAARAIADNRDDFAKLGVFSPEDTLTMLALDEAGARQFADGAEISSDDYNILQLRSSRLRSEKLNPTKAGALFKNLDPIAARATGLDMLYLTRRLLTLGALDRVKGLSQTASAEDVRLTMYGAAAVAFAQRDAPVALKRAVELNPHQYEALVLIARMLRDEIESGNTSVVAELANMPSHAQAVLHGWRLERQGRWEAVRALDAELGRVPLTDPIFVDANRLRALWRLESGEPERVAEATGLLDTALLFVADGEDFLLRAELALDEGFPGYAVTLANRIQPLLSRSSRPRYVVAEVNVLLARITPPAGLEPVLSRLRTEFRKLRGMR